MDYSIDFLPVGNRDGDAICIRYGSPENGYKTIVIDGGYSDVGDSVVEHLLKEFGTNHIDYMVLSHADNDHAVGLINVAQACTVGAVYMNRPWLFAAEIVQHFHGNYSVQGLVDRLKEMHPYLVDLERICALKGTPVYEVFQGTQIGVMTVLAPSRERYVTLLPRLDKTPETYTTLGRIFRGASSVISAGLEYWDVETLEENPDPTSASNETSLVQIGNFAGYRALFTGDVGPEGLMEAARYAELTNQRLPRPNLFQIPHQGSRRNVTPTVLNAWLGLPMPNGSDLIGRATCSVGVNKLSHPRKRVTNALHRRGYPTQVVREAAISFSNTVRYGWGVPAPQIPFYTDVTEDE